MRDIRPPCVSHSIITNVLKLTLSHLWSVVELAAVHPLDLQYSHFRFAHHQHLNLLLYRIQTLRLQAKTHHLIFKNEINVKRSFCLWLRLEAELFKEPLVLAGSVSFFKQLSDRLLGILASSFILERIHNHNALQIDFQRVSTHKHVNTNKHDKERTGWA